MMRSLVAIASLAAGCTSWDAAVMYPGVAELDGGAPAPDGGGTPTGLPCDVANLLSTRCLTCHGTTPTSKAPMSLVTYADLVAPSVSDPTVSAATMSLRRMQNAMSPMPPVPAPAVSPSEIAAFAAWVSAGTPQGTCTATDPWSVPPVCTSGSFYQPSGDGSGSMEPGRACVSCHQSGEGPGWIIGGTVYPTAHEPDRCRSQLPAQVTVVVTDAAGATYQMTTNSVGNFYSRNVYSVALPYHAKVVSGGQERAMVAAQTSGDCNACHTQSGTSGAPGRILAP